MNKLNLIIDRTAADAARSLYLNDLWIAGVFLGTLEEYNEWWSDLKGAYNASDLNRVENAVAYLVPILKALPPELKAYAESLDVAWDKFYAPNFEPEDMSLAIKTDWQESDTPTAEDMERYLGNVTTLRNAIDYATDALPASMDNLTWQGANAIERALKGLDTAIVEFRNKSMANMESAAAAWFYSDDIYTGEV